MSECKLCDKKAVEESLLCKECHLRRMLTASLDRIWQGRGLNLENMRAFSEENFIAMVEEE